MPGNAMVVEPDGERLLVGTSSVLYTIERNRTQNPL